MKNKFSIFLILRLISNSYYETCNLIRIMYRKAKEEVMSRVFTYFIVTTKNKRVLVYALKFSYPFSRLFIINDVTFAYDLSSPYLRVCILQCVISPAFGVLLMRFVSERWNIFEFNCRDGILGVFEESFIRSQILPPSKNFSTWMNNKSMIFSNLTSTREDQNFSYLPTLLPTKEIGQGEESIEGKFSSVNICTFCATLNSVLKTVALSAISENPKESQLLHTLLLLIITLILRITVFLIPTKAIIAHSMMIDNLIFLTHL